VTTLQQRVPLPDPTPSEALERSAELIGAHAAAATDRPWWARPCLIALLAGTAVLYLWGLGASGWANAFYSAAAQAGSKSWKAFFFGSFDSSNAITVDKPPASMWVMSLSARLFGVNAWSVLVPQALEGVAAVGVLYAAVKRWFGHGAGLLAGLVLAATPAAALMFRFNNPDALLTLVLVGAAYSMVRALEHARTRWLLLASTLVGLAFLTKMLQAFLVVPGFAIVYLIAAPTPVRRRLWQLTLAAVTLVVASLWWVVIVMAVPASSRPYIGGSQTNSLWDLIFGYNGFGRLTGNETGSVGGRGPGTGMWGPTGWTRLFNPEFGGQIAWLLPAALIVLASGVLFTIRARRTDRTRAALLLWGTWLLITGAVFSLSKGIIHPYYTVVLAPPIGAILGIGVTQLWRRRASFAARVALSSVLVVTALWSSTLLDRVPDWWSWLAPTVVVGGLGVAIALLFPPLLRGRWGKLVGAAAVIAGLVGTSSYTVATAAMPHEGAIPSTGPAAAARLGSFGRGERFGGFGGRATGGAPPAFGRAPAFGRVPPFGGLPGGAGFNPGRGFPGGPGGGIGGLLNTSKPSTELVKRLRANADDFTWVAAAVGSNSAAGYQLATDLPVMSIGGFNGTDPSPTLAEFKADVAARKIHYFIAGGGVGGFAGRGGTSGTISRWVASNFTATTVGGVTIYDLTAPAHANP
jgi:4-amino-4-deoxy-L-arabinose transferase-like glycosyltransferase